MKKKKLSQAEKQRRAAQSTGHDTFIGGDGKTFTMAKVGKGAYRLNM